MPPFEPSSFSSFPFRVFPLNWRTLKVKRARANRPGASKRRPWNLRSPHFSPPDWSAPDFRHEKSTRRKGKRGAPARFQGLQYALGESGTIHEGPKSWPKARERGSISTTIFFSRRSSNSISVVWSMAPNRSRGHVKQESANIGERRVRVRSSSSTTRGSGSFLSSRRCTGTIANTSFASLRLRRTSTHSRAAHLRGEGRALQAINARPERVGFTLSGLHKRTHVPSATHPIARRDQHAPRLQRKG